jgi:sRNA-binding protein
MAPRQIIDDKNLIQLIYLLSPRRIKTLMLEISDDHSSSTSETYVMTGAKAEKLRGLYEARSQIEVLKTRWPAIFGDRKAIRPLASTVMIDVAQALGWTNPYARGIFQVWKNQRAYCLAILKYPIRIHLDGTHSEELVDDRARELAAKRLEQIGASKALLKPKKAPKDGAVQYYQAGNGSAGLV